MVRRPHHRGQPLFWIVCEVVAEPGWGEGEAVDHDAVRMALDLHEDFGLREWEGAGREAIVSRLQDVAGAAASDEESGRESGEAC